MTRSDRYQKLVEAIDQAIYQQSWLGQYWGRAGAIALARVRCFCLIAELGKTERDVLSNLSSTYCSAAGNAWAQAKKSVAQMSFASPFWFWRAWRCLRQAVLRSDQLKKVAGGLKNLTADELDVRASIMFKAKRFKEAKACSNVGLQKVDISANTRCLLLLNSAQAQEKLGEDVAAAEAFQQARELKDKLSPGTQVRLLRALANRAARLGNVEKARQWKEEARIVAMAEGLDDQLAKLGT